MTPCEEIKTGLVAGETCPSCGHVNLVHRHGDSRQASCLLCQLDLLADAFANAMKEEGAK